MRTTQLPDVTSDLNADISSPLQWVGMEGIALPILTNWQTGALQTITSQANVYVNIKQENAKGIHMSRLHLLINKLAEIESNKENIESLLAEIIESQSGISNAARIQLSFDVVLKKSALLSGEKGYQAYPVILTAQIVEHIFSCEWEVKIPYSSTCPCSASLARQLLSNAIDQEFSGEEIDKKVLLEWIESAKGSVATPHSQRSYADIKLLLGANDWPDFSTLIHQLESAIGTPVQTAVKRIDEQEFARLNAQNLMFCEDAARRVKKTLEQINTVKDYWFKIEHRESLHAHNAVVIDKKVSD